MPAREPAAERRIERGDAGRRDIARRRPPTEPLTSACTSSLRARSSDSSSARAAEGMHFRFLFASAASIVRPLSAIKRKRVASV